MAGNGLKGLFDRDIPEQENEDDDLGPCASRATPKWWPGFHVKNATLLPGTAKTTRSFDYSHMGYREYDPSNTFFVIEINEPEKWRIRVEGRALWKLYNYLHQHRLEWIEAAVGRSAMAVPDGSPVIERITIQRIEDKAD
jgi:hypothetical protein